MIDFSNEGSEELELIPNGKYPVEITGCEEREYNGRKQISVKFSILEGKFKGRTIFYNINKEKNSDEYDNFSLKKILVFGQGWSKDRAEELKKKGVTVTFKDYNALIQYLNSGIRMEIETELRCDPNTGDFYKNPTIANFAPLSSDKKNGQTPVKTQEKPLSVDDTSDDLPF